MVRSPFGIGLAVIAWLFVARLASAQSTDQQSLRFVSDRVPAGDVVLVTDAKGATIKGRLAAIRDDEVQLSVKGDTRTIAAADVRRIEWRKPDSSLTGVLIGGAIGAIPGVYWLVADPNECTGMCPEDYLSIAVGATIGWFIDRSISRKVNVYEAQPSGGRPPFVTIGPRVTRNRLAAQIRVAF